VTNHEACHRSSFTSSAREPHPGKGSQTLVTLPVPLAASPGTPDGRAEGTHRPRNEASFDARLAKLSLELPRYFGSRVGPNADELAQEVCLRLLERRSDLESMPAEELRRVAYGFAWNVMMEFFRGVPRVGSSSKRERLVRAGVDDEAGGSDPNSVFERLASKAGIVDTMTPEAIVAARQTHRELLRAWESLPHAAREAVRERLEDAHNGDASVGPKCNRSRAALARGLRLIEAQIGSAGVVREGRRAIALVSPAPSSSPQAELAASDDSAAA